jgi:hypothetical protein
MRASPDIPQTEMCFKFKSSAIEATSAAALATVRPIRRLEPP